LDIVDHEENFHLIGLFLHVDHYAAMTFKVYVLAYYVDSTIARKELAGWKDTALNGVTPDMLNVLSDGIKIPGMMKYHMTLSCPGTKFQDGWFDEIKKNMQKENVDDAIQNSIDLTFHKWFSSKSFNNGDRFEFDWKFDKLPTKGTELTCIFNDETLSPISKIHEMTHSLVLHEFLMNGSLMINLLSTLWGQE